jgi:hypothetical protein
VRAFLIAVAACLLLAAPATAQAKKTPPKRKGGEVRRTHNLPKAPLARFLARQVGPVKTVPTARHRSLLAYTSAVSPNFVEDSSGNHKLYLARSYDIPADDPSAVRLANLSWTYDSAVAAIAFDSYGASYAAQELLDQLRMDHLQQRDTQDRALQRRDAVDRPVVRMALDVRVQLLGEVLRRVRERPREGRGSRLEQVVERALREIVLVKREHGRAPLFGPTHATCTTRSGCRP